MRKNSEVSFFLLTNAKTRNELFGKYQGFDIANWHRCLASGGTRVGGGRGPPLLLDPLQLTAVLDLEQGPVHKRQVVVGLLPHAQGRTLWKKTARYTVNGGAEMNDK